MFKSYLSYVITIIGSLLTCIMIIIDAIYYPSESYDEPIIYYILFLISILVTIIGIVLSRFFRDKNATSKNELILSYSSIIIGILFLIFSFISDHIVVMSVSFSLFLIAITTFLSTELGLNNNFSKKDLEYVIYNAFPNNIDRDIINVIKWLKLNHQFSDKYIAKNNENCFFYNYLTIPYRVYFKNIKTYGSLNYNSKMIYFCLQTRNSSGYVREEYIKKILEFSKLPQFAFPYILASSCDYVLNIVETIYNKLRLKDNIEIKEFLKNNLRQFRKSYSIMISYWNIYYKDDYPNYKDYPGYKLFTECLGFKKEYYNDANKLTSKEETLNKIWTIFYNDRFNENLFLLCDYYQGVMGDGHSLFFFNVSNSTHRYYTLNDYITKLKDLLPLNLYDNLITAYNSLGTKDEHTICLKADEFFYRHKKDYDDVLIKYNVCEGL